MGIKPVSIIFLLSLAITVLYPAYGLSNEELKYNKVNDNYKQPLPPQLQTVDNQNERKSEYRINGIKTVSKSDMYSNPRFALYDSQSGMVMLALPSYWNDPLLSCQVTFKCLTDFTTAWKNGTSFQISTINNTNNTWSWIQGKEIDVTPNDRYQLVTHMKLNEWAWASHFVMEGFNRTSKQWYEIMQCPSGYNGTLNWQEFSCDLKVPERTSKIRPVLNAGWSSQPGKEATTWFDALFMIKSSVSDPKLKIDLLYNGLKNPTSMAFLGPNDILVLERNGTVQRIVNGVKSDKPLLDLNVATTGERGMLGIAVNKNVELTQDSIANEHTFVFLYFTSAEKNDRDSIEGKEPPGNRLYRYEFVNNSLVNPLLLLDLPATPGPRHNGGAISIGPDGNLYLIIGDIDGFNNSRTQTKAQNYKNGTEPDGRSGILRISQDGKPVGEHGVLGDSMPLRLYYGYGIRNGFGLDFDPVTGSLWDTENGPAYGDEINLVEFGFNSGWRVVQGINKPVFNPLVGDSTAGDVILRPDKELVNFAGKGKYSKPEFIWNHTVGPTALKFLTTDKLGKEYRNDILVGDVDKGRIYHFKLNQNRTGILLQDALFDKIADTDTELDDVVFAEGFGSITDIEIGPDGYPYFVDYKAGKIYRIVPNYPNEDPLSYLTNLP
jgi:aldose sugar dehydrogenase